MLVYENKYKSKDVISNEDEEIIGRVVAIPLGHTLEVLLYNNLTYYNFMTKDKKRGVVYRDLFFDRLTVLVED